MDHISSSLFKQPSKLSELPLYDSPAPGCVTSTRKNDPLSDMPQVPMVIRDKEDDNFSCKMAIGSEN
jgi:hypothetical protein